MTLQASGQIDMSDINVELGLSGSTQINLGGAGPRGLAGVASGQIRLGADFYGKSSVPPYSLTSPTPGGFAEGYGVHPGNAIATVTTSTDGTITGTGWAPVAFGSTTGAGVATGKYWKWTYVSGSTPNNTTMTENVWYAVGTGYVGQNRETAGSRGGTVAISFANDSGGSGATTAGNWVITAVVDI